MNRWFTVGLVSLLGLAHTQCTEVEPNAPVREPRPVQPRTRFVQNDETAANVPPATGKSDAAERQQILAAENYVVAMEGLALLFSKPNEECARLAKSLVPNTPQVVELKLRSTGTAHRIASADALLSPRLESATNTIIDVSMKCATSKPFQKALAVARIGPERASSK